MAASLPRNAMGWREPRQGTKSRRVYDLLLKGYSTDCILSRVGGTRNTLKVIIWKIKHPERANAHERGYYSAH